MTLGLTVATTLMSLRLRKDRDGFNLISDGFRVRPNLVFGIRRGPPCGRVRDDVRRGNSLNRISAGEFANRRSGTG